MHPPEKALPIENEVDPSFKNMYSAGSVIDKPENLSS